MGIRLLYASEPKQGDRQQLTAAVLFARTLEHYQAAVLLLERGAIPSAKALLRVMCEATFALAACAKDLGFIAEYVNDDRRRQVAMFEALLSIPPEANAVPAAELEKMRKDAAALRAEIKADRQGKLIAFETARRAGLIDFYRLFYVPYSNVVHSAVRDLGGHVTETAQGDISSLRWGPDSGHVDDTVDAAVQIFFAAAHSVLQIFPNAAAEKEFERIWSEHQRRVERKTEERLKDDGAR